MKYTINDLYLDRKEQTLEITMPNYSAFLDFPEIIKGFGKNPDEDKILDKAIEKISQNSNLEELKLKAESLLELPDQDITALFQKFVYGEFQEIEIENITANTKQVAFYDLLNNRHEVKAKTLSALVSRKYRDLLKGAKTEKPSQKEIELFFVGLSKSIAECLIDSSLTSEKLLEDFSVFALVSIYQNLSKTNFTMAVTPAS